MMSWNRWKFSYTAGNEISQMLSILYTIDLWWWEMCSRRLATQQYHLIQMYLRNDLNELQGSLERLLFLKFMANN